ncbi:hypothetical protein, partial [Streptomyces antibioticus]|uniref:hypothetical protein n=1 Tax=Streptomyces antibioticus TaxID=1890 RepID=UPI0036C0B010
MLTRIGELGRHRDSAFTHARADYVAALASGDAHGLEVVSSSLAEMGADLLAAEASAAAALNSPGARCRALSLFGASAREVAESLSIARRSLEKHVVPPRRPG